MTRIQEIQQQIGELQGELRKLQEVCPHPPTAVKYFYNSNTGNWDSGSDSYWTELHCGLCDKSWREDGHGEVHVHAQRVKSREEL